MTANEEALLAIAEQYPECRREALALLTEEFRRENPNLCFGGEVRKGFLRGQLEAGEKRKRAGVKASIGILNIALDAADIPRGLGKRTPSQYHRGSQKIRHTMI